MDWSITGTIISAICGGGFVTFATLIMNRKATKRKAEAEADKAVAQVHNEEWQQLKDQFAQLDGQLDRMNAQIEFKDGRIMSLNQEIAEKENRYMDQTKRLREVQDRETKLVAENQRLTEEVCSLRIKLKDTKCVKLTCLDRKPENEHTRRARTLNAAKTKAEEDD